MSAPKKMPVSWPVLIVIVVVLGFMAGYLTSLSNSLLMSVGFGLWVFLFVAILGTALTQVSWAKNSAKTKSKKR